jgi:hypothetical protein
VWGGMGLTPRGRQYVCIARVRKRGEERDVPLPGPAPNAGEAGGGLSSHGRRLIRAARVRRLCSVRWALVSGEHRGAARLCVVDGEVVWWRWWRVGWVVGGGGEEGGGERGGVLVMLLLVLWLVGVLMLVVVVSVMGWVLV